MKRHLFKLLILLSTLTAANRAEAGGYLDNHDRVGLKGWTKVGPRGWTESGGQALPTDAQGQEGFLITQYPTSDNGTLEATLTASDPWNAQNGGLVFRWTSANAFYFVSVKPGNQWDSALFLTKNSTDPNKGIVLARNLQITNTFTLKVDVQGSSFTFYINGTAVATATDADHPTGRVGYAYSSQWNRYVSYGQSSWQDAPGSAAPTVQVVPGSVDPTKVKLEVHLLDEGLNENNFIKPRLYIKNTGSETVNRLRFYYYFNVAENKIPILDKTPLLEKWYAPNTSVSLADLGNNQWVIEYIVTNIYLQPGNAFPDTSGLVVGIHFADYSAMDKSDDFSNPASSSFIVSNKIPIYLLDIKSPGSSPTVGGGTDSSTTQAAGDPPVSGTNPPAKVAYQHLGLLRLHCDETESFWEDDKAVLAVYMDGQFVRSYGVHGMDDGYDWDINDDSDLYFKDTATMTLYDHDGWSILGNDFDSDDYLGSIAAHYDGAAWAWGRFNQDGANYWLTYTNTTEYFDETVKGPEDIAYNNFKNSTTTGVWPSIPDKSKLITDMVLQMYKISPRGFNVYQGDTNKYATCGPTAVVYDLLTKSPLRYVIAVRDLYQTGRLHGSLDDIVPPEAVRSQTVDDGLATDLWILYASMKGDRLGKFEGSYADVGDMKDWLTNLSGFQYTEFTHTWFYGETDALEHGIDTINNYNGVSIENINIELLQQSPEHGSLWGNLDNWPDHWVALVAKPGVPWGSQYVADDGSVSFDVYSGSKPGRIIHVNVDEGTFEDYFWGALYGW